LCDRHDVIERIAVVRDQSAAKVVASQFDFIRVNLVDRGDDGFAVSLEHSLGWSDSGGCKLRVDRWAEALNVASNFVQCDAMRGQRSWTLILDWDVVSVVSIESKLIAEVGLLT